MASHLIKKITCIMKTCLAIARCTKSCIYCLIVIVYLSEYRKSLFIYFLIDQMHSNITYIEIICVNFI